MIPLVNWTNAVRKEFSFRVDKQKASNQSVKSLLQELREHRSSYDNNDDILLLMFKEYITAWNKFLDISPVFSLNLRMREEELNNPDCHDMEIIPNRLTEDDDLNASCIRLNGKGKEITYVLHYLGEIQNNFLKKCLPYLRSMDRGTLQCRLQEIKKEDIILYDRVELWEKLARYTRSSLSYGGGGRIECDWERIELKIIELLIDGKKFLQTNIWKLYAVDEFRFKHEMFRKDQTNLFYRVSQIVSQVKSDPSFDHFDDHMVKDKTEVESKLLPAIQALLNILQYQSKSTPINYSDMTLEKFAQLYLDEGVIRIFKEMSERNSNIPRIKLKLIEAFYEMLEDTISTTILGCLHDRFRVELPKTFDKSKITEFASREVGSIVVFESLWCRFIMRYLRDSEQLNPSDSMIYYLRFIRWPNGTDIDELEDKEETIELFSSLQIQHSYEVWVYINNIQAETLRYENEKNRFECFDIPDEEPNKQQQQQAIRTQNKRNNKKRTVGLS